MHPIEIFRTGTHTAMSGERIAFTEADLSAAAAAYDPALHEAPIVVGHPASDAPAYGWIKDLGFSEGRLAATPDQVDPGFAELVSAGRFKKVSAAFYKPDAEANPKPGAYYLRHVGFLGAQPPAVKGLKPVTFAEDEDGVVIFGEIDDPLTTKLLRRFGRFLTGQTELEREDDPAFAETKLSRMLNKAIDGSDDDRSDVIRRMAGAAGIDAGTVQQILRGEIERPPDRRLRGFARVLDLSFDALESALPSAAFTEKIEEESKVDKDNKEAAAELETQRSRLEKDETAFVEKEKEHAETVTAFRREQAGATVDRLVAEGRVAPGHKDGLAAFMAGLDDEKDSIAFGEGEDGKGKSLTPRAYFEAFLGALPKQIAFGELAGGGTDGEAADPEAVAEAAVVYQEEMKGKGITVSTERAVRHVLKGASA